MIAVWTRPFSDRSCRHFSRSNQQPLPPPLALDLKEVLDY